MRPAIIKVYILIVLFIIRVDAFTQSQWLDSTQKLLRTQREDSNKVKTLLDLAGYYVRNHPDTGIIYAQKALDLSAALKFDNGLLTAQELFSIALTFTGNYPLGLDYAFKTLDLAEKIDPSVRGWAYSTISYNYYYLGDYNTCLHYTREAMKIALPWEMPLGWRDHARAFHALHEPDSAMLYAKKAYATLVYTGEGNISNILGNAYAGKGMYDSAIVLYHAGIVVALRDYIKTELVDNYCSLAALYKITNKPDSATWYARQVLNQQIEKSYPSGLLIAANMLATIYEEQKKPDSTLKYLKIAINVKDSLFSREKTMAIQNVAFKEQEKQKEIEASELKYRNRLRTYSLLGGLLALGIIAVILSRNLRSKQTANALLQQQKEKVESTLTELKSTQSQLIQSEKMASLGELTAGIAHEIQNPLNFVNNFSEVNTELLDELKSGLAAGNLQLANEVADNIRVNEQKINHHGRRADAIVKGMLQHTQRSSSIKEATDINALATEYLQLAYHGLRGKDKTFNAAMKTDFDETVSTIQVIPQDIGRALLNLYNNAFYAVNEKRKENNEKYEPTVAVSTKKVNDKIEIKVADNGKGIPQPNIDKIFQPFFTTKPTGQGTGLGLSLSYDIIKAHDGEISVTSIEGEGSEFVIRLPVR